MKYNKGPFACEFDLMTITYDSPHTSAARYRTHFSLCYLLTTHVFVPLFHEYSPALMFKECLSAAWESHDWKCLCLNVKLNRHCVRGPVLSLGLHWDGEGGFHKQRIETCVSDVCGAMVPRLNRALTWKKIRVSSKSD